MRSNYVSVVLVRCACARVVNARAGLIGPAPVVVRLAVATADLLHERAALADVEARAGAGGTARIAWLVMTNRTAGALRHAVIHARAIVCDAGAGLICEAPVVVGLAVATADFLHERAALADVDAGRRAGGSARVAHIIMSSQRKRAPAQAIGLAVDRCSRQGVSGKGR